MNQGNTSKNHRIRIAEGTLSFETLEDILPDSRPARLLIIGKRPVPDSVRAGHYLQGRQGKMFWRMLRRYELLPMSKGYEDDLLVSMGYGITDIVKKPGKPGDEPTDEEYMRGAKGISDLLADLLPHVVLFIYKPPMEQMTRYLAKRLPIVQYGFNASLSRVYGRKVFLFPMPGTPCSKQQQLLAMAALTKALR